MKGNSVNATRNSLISKRCLKRFLAFVGAATTTVAVLTSSIQAAEDTSDWETVEATPYIFWCPASQNDGTFQQLEVGTVTDEVYPSHLDLSILSLATYMPVYNDCTYQIEFTVKYINFASTVKALNLSEKYPSDIGVLTEQKNIAGENYTDLMSLTMSDYTVPSRDEQNEVGGYWYGSYVATKFTYSFSTADGYIDNLENGYKYVILSNIVEPSSEERPYQFMITDINVKVLFDPGAEYYTDRVIEDLNEKAEKLDEVGSKLSEAENWLLTKAESMKTSIADDMSNALAQAASLVSPARSNTSILAPLTSFGTLYATFTNSLPGVLQALLVACPLLMFVAWLIGRNQ